MFKNFIFNNCFIIPIITTKNCFNYFHLNNDSCLIYLYYSFNSFFRKINTIFIDPINNYQFFKNLHFIK